MLEEESLSQAVCKADDFQNSVFALLSSLKFQSRIYISFARQSIIILKCHSNIVPSPALNGSVECNLYL